MKKITILRKWNNPEIIITMTDELIGMEMTLPDFLRAMADEVAEPLVAQVVEDAGNPLLWLSSAGLSKRLIAAIEGDKMNTLFVAAADRVVTAVKQETNKVV